MKASSRILLAVCLLLGGLPARAHKPSDSYLSLTLSGPRIEGRWDVALRDLEYAMGLDRDGDGVITWGELRTQAREVDQYVLSRLKMEADGSVCPPTPGTHRVVRHSDGAYVAISFTAICPRPASALIIEYSLLFDKDPQHRGLARIEEGGAVRTALFSTGSRRIRLSVRSQGRGRQFLAMIRSGIEHIATGPDHILFLLALLLPSVLQREGDRWMPLPRFRPALADVIKIVSAFTVAHSLTLSLAALDVIRLPSRFVESAIAASVVVAGLNNLIPILRKDRWIAAFSLGLLHGFGFSAALLDLDLPKNQMVLTLFGFNLGVELGQLAVVAAFLPLAYWLRGSVAYRRFLMVGGSFGILAVASIWFAERAFQLRLFPT